MDISPYWCRLRVGEDVPRGTAVAVAFETPIRDGSKAAQVEVPVDLQLGPVFERLGRIEDLVGVATLVAAGAGDLLAVAGGELLQLLPLGEEVLQLRQLRQLLQAAGRE